MEAVDTILDACERINNSRTVMSVFSHLSGEVVELRDEVRKHVMGEMQGKDGIIGESVDVILCAVDLIYMKDPTITKEQILEVIKEKIQKWETKYGNS